MTGHTTVLLTAPSGLSYRLSKSSPVTGAGPEGVDEPFGSGRGPHEWTDWTAVADPGVEEDLCERVCLVCGTAQVTPADSLVSITALRPWWTASIRREAA